MELCYVLCGGINVMRLCELITSIKILVMARLVCSHQGPAGPLPYCASLTKSVARVNLLENIVFQYSSEIFLMGHNLTCSSSCTAAVVIVNSTITRSPFKSRNQSDSITFIFRTKRLGTAQIKCVCLYTNSPFHVLNITVERQMTLTEIVFRILLSAFVISTTFLMGCSTNMATLARFVNKPMAPAIGLLGQYLMMPLMGFALSKLLYMNNEFGIGLLVVGCCPGGGYSHIWTMLYKGDLALSLTMNVISTIVAFLMVPFWIFCLGRFYADTQFASVPFGYIFLNVLQIVLPLLAGVFFRWKWEKLSLRLMKIIRVLSFAFILFMLTFGIYANLYMYDFAMDYPYLVYISALFPAIGLVICFVFSIVFRLGVVQSLTISVEVGLQNVALALLLFKLFVPKPHGDMAAVIPFFISIISPLPLMLCFIGKLIRAKFYTEKEKSVEDVNNFPASSYTIYQPAFLLTDIKAKESLIEPTMYYTEEPSEGLDSAVD